MKIAVVGGGIIGCASALALSLRGATVHLFEQGALGAEASSAAAGILGAQVELHGRESLRELFVRGRESYGAWSAQLLAETSFDVGYRRSGALQVAFTEEQARALHEEAAWQSGAGLAAEIVTAKEAREIEPAASEAMLTAVHLPDEAQVDPPLLMRALIARIAKSRIVVHAGVPVLGLDALRERCRGVRLAAGNFETDAVVLAAGAWSSLVAGAPSGMPRVRPIRGQLVELSGSAVPVRTILVGPESYIVPRNGGRVVCGSTTEHVGFSRGVTAGGIGAILNRSTALAPPLAAAALIRSWSGFRPEIEGSAEPLVAKSDLPGLVYATGHYRNGILLAKVTSDMVADLVLGA